VPSKRNSVNLRLAKSILLNEGLPNDCLSVTPSALFQKLTQMEVEELKNDKSAGTRNVQPQAVVVAEPEQTQPEQTP